MVDADLLSNTATSSNVSNLCFLCGLSFLPNASSTLLVSCPTRSIKRDTACGNCSNVMLSIYLCFVLLFECYLYGSLALQVIHHIGIDLCRSDIAVRKHL